MTMKYDLRRSSSSGGVVPAEQPRNRLKVTPPRRSTERAFIRSFMNLELIRESCRGYHGSLGFLFGAGHKNQRWSWCSSLQTTQRVVYVYVSFF